MIKLFFDIETVPGDDTAKEIFRELYHMKEKKKDPDYDWATANARVDDRFLETSFDGAFGRICAIAVILEGNDFIERYTLTGSEPEILSAFWALAAKANLYVGHNIFDFDFPFVYKRSVIKKIKPLNISLAHYRNSPVYDTMQEWLKWARSAQTSSLHALALLFGFPSSKDDMDGSQVWGAYQEGKIKEIGTYCMKDVELTRQIYYRLSGEEMPAH